MLYAQQVITGGILAFKNTRRSDGSARQCAVAAMALPYALALDAILVTNDHVFERVKKLKIADWTKAAR